MEVLLEDVLLETKRLRIRAFASDDAPLLYKNHLDDEVKKWFPYECYQDLQEAQEAIQFYRDCVRQKRLPYYVLAVGAESNRRADREQRRKRSGGQAR